MRRSVPVLAFLVGVCIAVPGVAGERVVFDDGRSLIVASWRPQGPLAVLELQGGGAITVPAARIERVLPVAEAGVTALGRGGALGGEVEWRGWAGEFADLFLEAAERHRLRPELLVAMARVESNFDPRAVSPKGAQGLLQLIPATAERFGVQDVFDPAQNIDGGAKYLRWLLDRFDGRTDLALAAYNAGENAVERHRGVPPFLETRHYVSRVLGHLDRLTLAPR